MQSRLQFAALDELNDSKEINAHEKQSTAIVTLATETSVTEEYDNHAVANVNDHVVRISRMTQPYYWHYYWHSHPNSDETFLAVAGGLVIESEHGEIQLAPGQMATVSRGIRHRTRSLKASSVNLIFEAADAQTVPSARLPFLIDSDVAISLVPGPYQPVPVKV